ncbi:MAG: acyl-CoA thioesterase [Gammaproteobacteria bacterium]|nr:acyl-CoA thioesterase [Gammaproteobacteria bacterium]
MVETQGSLVHTEDITVRWCDMDAFGHVNNSVFFSYFESTRIAWWRTIAPTNVDWQDQGPVIINAACTFLKPIIYPEKLIIQLFVGPPGRSSHECYYKIISQNDTSLCYAEGSTKVVWVDRKLNRSIPLPDYIVKNLPQSK